MSVEGEFTESRGEYTGGHPEVLVLDAYLVNGERLKDAIEMATAGPTAATVAELRATVEEARGYIKQLHEANFFKDTGNNMLVSTAIATYAENIKIALLCINRLYPSPELTVTIRPVQLQGETVPPSLEITPQIGPTPIEDEDRERATIAKLAELMAQRNSYEAGRVSTQMYANGTYAYDKLLTGLEVYPPTKEFLKKERRLNQLKSAAKMVGRFVVAASKATKYL